VLALETAITQRIAQANLASDNSRVMVNDSWNVRDNGIVDALKKRAEKYKNQRMVFEKRFFEIQQEHYDFQLPDGFVTLDEATSEPVDPFATGED